MHLQVLQNRSTLQPKKGHQRDPYIGPLHTQTKKRHGKGNYQYKNKYFEYHGQYDQGKKYGLGILKMNDGTKIQANFQQDQIQGQGKILYPDGSYYNGSLQNGEKHGKGRFQSTFQIYEGEWSQNSRQGQGKLHILSTDQTLEGTFKKNKLQGQGSLKSYNYSYKGEWNNGKKQGQGEQHSLWRRVQPEQVQTEAQAQATYEKKKNYDRYQYKGNFLYDQFNGQGKYMSNTSNYVYDGTFVQGLPTNYPNQFRIHISSNVRNQNAQTAEGQKILLQASSVFEYQLQGDSKNIYVQTVYQGNSYLDEVQPSEEQIQLMVKNWQNQNKKNKNPPPMPDFRTPKMKKPQLVVVPEESLRNIQFTLSRQTNQSKAQLMKIDYRKQILQKRAEFEKIKEEQRKNQDEDPKKKGGKKQTKAESQFKVNLFKESPSGKQKSVNLQTISSSCCFQKFQLPDDFPQGKFFIDIRSKFQDFGQVQPRRIELMVKTKQAAGKKK